MTKNWKDNKIVQRIIELKKDYVFRHGYAGHSIGYAFPTIDNLWEYDCCSNLVTSRECLYHKTEQNKGIAICDNCSMLWSLVDEEKSVEMELPISQTGDFLDNVLPISCCHTSETYKINLVGKNKSKKGDTKLIVLFAKDYNKFDDALKMRVKIWNLMIKAVGSKLLKDGK